MKKKIKDFIEWRKQSNGFLTSTGKILSRPELHGLVIGIGAGMAGDTNALAALYGLVTSGKKLTGHLKDAKKEFGYTVGGFGFWEYALPRIIELVQVVL